MRVALNQPRSPLADPRNRKWVLAALVALLAFDVRLWVIWPHPNKLEPITVTAGAVVILFNHVVRGFLSPESQRRMVWPETILIGLFCGLGLTFWFETFIR